MHRIIYLSSAVSPFSREDLRELLVKSRANNTALGITGALFYKDGSFLQVIEGPRQTVHDLYVKIAQDLRHTQITQLFNEPITTREFEDWSMAFRDASQLPENSMPGFNDLLNRKRPAEDLEVYSSKIRAFLTMFNTH